MPTMGLHAVSYENAQKYQNQRFYAPRLYFDRSLYPEGEKIPVVLKVNKNICGKDKDSQQADTGPAGKVQPPIDQWDPEEKEKIFTHIRGAIIAPIHTFFGMSETDAANNMIDYFYVTSKRCYNSDTKMKDGEINIGFRDHCTSYMNYFERFYDTELQLLAMYANIKYLIDCEPRYTLEMFYNDLWRYFINPTATYTSQCLNYQLDKMNLEQYTLELSYKNNKSPVLEYNDFHAKVMMKISVMQNIMIPLITHFITKRKVEQSKIKHVLLSAFDMLFQMCNRIYNVDIGSKIYETTTSNVTKNISNNSILWDMQTIRGRNSTTHSVETVENLIMQIIPKYTYSKNIIHFNYNAINREIKFRVTEVPYEFGFVVLSSSNRDEDNNSECDKFEAHAAKINEAIMLQTLVNCSTTMERIELKYGPFDENEILFYYNQLCRDGKFIVNGLQKTLVTYLFAKEFDDPQSTKIVNIRQYIILIIAARRLLESYHMFQLPYLIGGRVNRLVTRKNINKKELQKIESSEYYPLIHAKYNNEKIEKDIILSLIAQILSSEFQTIDYYNPAANGIIVGVIPDVISEEVCRFVMLI